MSIKAKILMLKGEKGDSAAATWGSITGTLSNQTDLNTALNGKANTADLKWGNLTGNIADQTDLKNELDSKVDTSSIFDLIYPVGCYYWSSNSTNPSTLFGGTWEQIEDKFILAAGTTYSEGATGGEASHKLVLNEIPSHRHTTGPSTNWAYGGMNGEVIQKGEGARTSLDKIYTGYVGGGQSHNNMPPYLVAYCWHRTA